MRLRSQLTLLALLCFSCTPSQNPDAGPSDAGLVDAGLSDAGPRQTLDFSAFPNELLRHLPSPDTPQIEVEYLGQDFGQRLEFDVPENTLAFTLVLIDFDSTEPLQVLNARDPGGYDHITQGGDRVLVGTVYRSTALIPNDANGAAAGTWQIQTQSQSSTHAFVIHRVGNVPENATIDIAFINNTSGSIDAQVEASRSALSNAFAGANISVGNALIIDASLPLSQPLRLVGENCTLAADDLKALQDLDIPRHTVPVVVVERFICEGQSVGGLAGFTTGIPGLPGAATDAVFAQSFNQNTLSEAESALLVTHEVAHFLGLFHVRDLDLFDNLDDTFEDDNNLMENVVSIRSDNITPMQAHVMRASPWVKAVE